MRRLALALGSLAALAALASVRSAAARPGPGSPAALAPVGSWAPAAERLVGAALVDDTAYRRLEWLSDRIGCRLSGSPALEKAVDWAESEMRKDGLDDVHRERCRVPRWVRGRESATLLEPTERRLMALGLGNSVGTPAGGITAEVAVVTSFSELDALGEAGVRGKIVLFLVPFTKYGETVAYRVAGPSRAAKLGAVAALVRSVTPVSLATPHTGTLHYDEAAPKIPAAALAIEDAELIARCRARGETVRVHLEMEAHWGPDAESANVVGEVRGSERPDEVVLLGGHLDSWDVGQGSNDDGGGAIVSWEAVRLVRRLGLKPRRTLRCVLFTNEENGGAGAKAYLAAHESELARFVLAIESDSGIARPSGFGLAASASAASRARVQEIAALLRGIGASGVAPEGGGADVGPLMEHGVLGGSLWVDESHYFDVHHTNADTFEKIDRVQLGLCGASMAVLGYVAADLPDRLDGK